MAQINVRVDDGLKRDAELICKGLGLSLSAAVNIYLTKLVREKGIPFDMQLDPFYSSENEEVLDRRITDMREGKNMSEHDRIEV